MTPQPDGIVSAHWALTLSLAILSQKSCQGKCALKLSSFSHLPVSLLHHTIPVISVRSISGHTILCSPKPLSFFYFSPVDTYYSQAKICSIIYHVVLIGQLF